MRQTVFRFVVVLLFAVGAGCAPSLPAAEAPKPSIQTSTPSPSPSPTPSPAPSPTPTPSPTPGPPEGYTLAFADEFDQPAINETIWNFETGPWPYNEELEYYRPENAWVEDGNLVIEARAEAFEGRSYTSARLTTQDKLDLTYGYIEVRAALPVGRGTWSAVWLLPTDLRYGGYLHSGEIDVAERVGYDAKRVHHSIHTYQNNAVSNNAITASSRLTKKDAAFHIYGLLWTDDSLRIYQDGAEALNYRRAENATPETWPFDVPFHLILNLAVGGTWGGAKGVDDAAFPQQMYIDYIRYYTPSATPEP